MLKMLTLSRQLNLANGIDYNRILRIALIILLVFSTCFADLAIAEDSNSDISKDDSELSDLEKQVAIAEQKQALAEAKQAEAEALMSAALAKFPTTETEGLEGKVTIENEAGYYSEILAYEALEKVSEEIAEKLKTILTDEKLTLFILGDVDLSKEATLWYILDTKISDTRKALNISIKEYNKDKSAWLALAAAPAILGAVADIVAFFKINRTIAGRKVNVSEKALISSVANAIKTRFTIIEKDDSGKNIREIVPEIILPDRKLKNGKLLDSLISIMEQRDQLILIKKEMIKNEGQIIDDTLDQIEWLETQADINNKVIAKFIADGKDIKELILDLKIIVDEKRDLNKKISKKLKILSSLDTEIDAANKFIGSFLEKKSNSDLSLIESVYLIDQIKSMTSPAAEGSTTSPAAEGSTTSPAAEGSTTSPTVENWKKEDKNIPILFLSIATQGGETETSESKFSQGRVSYLGGTVITYFLTDIKGQYISSGNVKGTRTGTYKRSEGVIKMKTVDIQ